MPVLPGISDMADTIMGLVGEAASRGADFVCGGGLTLRPGVQKAGTLALIEERYPQHLPGYVKIFGQEYPSGAALPRYYERINQRISTALRRHQMPGRIPRRLFTGQVPCYTEVAVLLEHREFDRSLSGGGPPLGRVGFAIQKWARGRFARRRSRSFTWRDLELEFRQLVASGEICSLPGMIAAARPLIEELLAGTSECSTRV